MDLGNVFSPVTDSFGGSSSSGLGGAVWFAGILLGIAIIAIIGIFIYFFYYERKKWNLITRVHYENPSINGVSIGHTVPTARVRFKDGKVVYIFKSPIQGYTICPELYVWTRPREHDIIVTQDKKLFCIEGVENIDIKRKKLNVEISYPDIEMDRQDLQHYIDQKKYDDPNEKLKLIAKASMWIFALLSIIIISVLAGNYYIESKEIDAQRDSTNLRIAEQQKEVMASVNTAMKIMQEVINKIEADQLNISSTST